MTVLTTQEDAASWTGLFAEVERRREVTDIPSMKAPVETADTEYVHDFGDMEFSF